MYHATKCKTTGVSEKSGILELVNQSKKIRKIKNVVSE